MTFKRRVLYIWSHVSWEAHELRESLPNLVVFFYAVFLAVVSHAFIRPKYAACLYFAIGHWLPKLRIVFDNNSIYVRKILCERFRIFCHCDKQRCHTTFDWNHRNIRLDLASQFQEILTICRPTKNPKATTGI